MYSANFTEYGKKFCLRLHYNGDNSYLFVNAKEIVKFKAKDSENVPYPLCLTGISEDFSSTMQHDYMDIFMILASITKPIQIIKYMIFTLM